MSRGNNKYECMSLTAYCLACYLVCLCVHLYPYIPMHMEAGHILGESLIAFKVHAEK